MRAWTGNQPQIIEHSPESFTRLADEGNSLITAVRSDGIALTPGSRDLPGQVDKALSAGFRRALDRKAQAAYEARDIAASDAKACVRQAAALLDAARSRVQAI